MRDDVERVAMTAREIAAKLTKAQREAMIALWSTVGVARGLKRKGLISGYLGNDPRNVAIVETDLGFEVRAILQEQSNER